MTDDDYAALDALLMTLREQHDEVPPLETLDGFLTALACGPREVPRDEYLPVLLGIARGQDLGFGEPAAERRFLDLLERRWDEIVGGLSAPVESLDDVRALQPALTDWDGARADLAAGTLSEADREALAHWPSIGEPWANGFLMAVEHWADDWDLPAGDEDDFVNECLGAFEVLVVPAEELDAARRDAIRQSTRDELVGEAIWAAYDLRRFWQAWTATDGGRLPDGPLH